MKSKILVIMATALATFILLVPIAVSRDAGAIPITMATRCPGAISGGAFGWLSWSSWVTGNSVLYLDATSETSKNIDNNVSFFSSGFTAVNQAYTYQQDDGTNESGLYPYIAGFVQPLPPDNATILSVYAIVVMKTQLNSGQLFVYYGNKTYNQNYPEYYTNLSGLFPWQKSGTFPMMGLFDNDAVIDCMANYNVRGHQFNITSSYTWTAQMLKSPLLTVMWAMSPHPDHWLQVNYVGLFYTWTGYYTVPPFSGDVGTQTQGLIWLLIFFAPAIAMNQFIPKLGFVAGIGLMLLIIPFVSTHGTSYTNFLPFTILGFSAIGVMLYKGG